MPATLSCPLPWTHDPYTPAEPLCSWPLRGCHLPVSHRASREAGGVWLVMGQSHQKRELSYNALVLMASLWDVEVTCVEPAGKYLVAFQVRDQAAAAEMLMRSGQAFFFGDALYVARTMRDPEWMKEQLASLQADHPEVKGPKHCVQFELCAKLMK